MNVHVELRPETEAGLRARASAAGFSLEQYVVRLLEADVSQPAPLSPGERAALWRDTAKALPRTPPLADSAISREAIYDERG